MALATDIIYPTETYAYLLMLISIGHLCLRVGTADGSVVVCISRSLYRDEQNSALISTNWYYHRAI